MTRSGGDSLRRVQPWRLAAIGRLRPRLRQLPHRIRIALARLVDEREHELLPEGLAREVRHLVDAHVLRLDLARRLRLERAEQAVPQRQEQAEVAVALPAP